MDNDDDDKIVIFFLFLFHLDTSEKKRRQNKKWSFKSIQINRYPNGNQCEQTGISAGNQTIQKKEDKTKEKRALRLSNQLFAYKSDMQCPPY